MSKIKKIIEDMGGTLKVAYQCNVSQNNVYRWRSDGIPEKHWKFFVAAGYTPEELHNANQELRDEDNNI